MKEIGNTPRLALVLGFLLPMELNAVPIIERPAEGVPRPAVDSVHRVIKGGVHKLADSIDRFFGSQLYIEEEQKTRLRIRSTVGWFRGGEYDFKLSVRARVSLPRVEDRWQIFISRFADQGEDQITDERDIILDRDKDEDDTLIGVQYVFYSKILRHFKLRGGPRFREGKVKAYIAARARFSKDYFSWLLRFTETLYFDNDEFGERSNMDFERSLGQKTLLSWHNSMTFSESSEGLDLSSIWGIRYLNTQYMATGISIGAAAHTRPISVIDSYYLALHFRHRLGREWAYFSLRPEARFPRDLDYEYDPALYATLEIIF